MWPRHLVVTDLCVARAQQTVANVVQRCTATRVGLPVVLLSRDSIRYFPSSKTMAQVVVFVSVLFLFVCLFYESMQS